jgi:hypothetical protein
VIDEQLVRLIRAAERRQHGPAEIGNRSVVDWPWPMGEIANAWRLGVISDRVQCAARQIPEQNIVRLVETRDRIASQVVNTTLTNTYVGYGYDSSFLPIFPIGKITKRQRDEEGILSLE